MSLRRGQNTPLALGAILGIVLAGAGLVRGGPRGAAVAPSGAEPAELSEDVVATVNGAPIRRSEYESALAALASERRDGALDAAQKRHVLDRLIDEELLIQEALALGLANKDRRVRADLSSAAVDFLLDAPGAEAPTESELRAYFEAHKGEMTTGARLSVEVVYLARRPGEDDTGLLARAQASRAAMLTGGVASSDPLPLPLPRGALSVRTLERYLGPAAASEAERLAVGDWSDAVVGPGGATVVHLVSREGGVTPPFEDVRDSVRLAYQRRAGDERIRRFLGERRKGARIALREDPGR